MTTKHPTADCSAIKYTIKFSQKKRCVLIVYSLFLVCNFSCPSFSFSFWFFALSFNFLKFSQPLAAFLTYQYNLSLCPFRKWDLNESCTLNGTRLDFFMSHLRCLNFKHHFVSPYIQLSSLSHPKFNTMS